MAESRIGPQMVSQLRRQASPCNTHQQALEQQEQALQQALRQLQQQKTLQQRSHVQQQEQQRLPLSQTAVIASHQQEIVYDYPKRLFVERQVFASQQRFHGMSLDQPRQDGIQATANLVPSTMPQEGAISRLTCRCNTVVLFPRSVLERTCWRCGRCLKLFQPGIDIATASGSNAATLVPVPHPHPQIQMASNVSELGEIARPLEAARLQPQQCLPMYGGAQLHYMPPAPLHAEAPFINCQPEPLLAPGVTPLRPADLQTQLMAAEQQMQHEVLRPRDLPSVPRPKELHRPRALWASALALFAFSSVSRVIRIPTEPLQSQLASSPSRRQRVWLVSFLFMFFICLSVIVNLRPRAVVGNPVSSDLVELKALAAESYDANGVGHQILDPVAFHVPDCASSKHPAESDCYMDRVAVHMPTMGDSSSCQDRLEASVHNIDGIWSLDTDCSCALAAHMYRVPPEAVFTHESSFRDPQSKGLSESCEDCYARHASATCALRTTKGGCDKNLHHLTKIWNGSCSSSVAFKAEEQHIASTRTTSAASRPVDENVPGPLTSDSQTFGEGDDDFTLYLESSHQGSRRIFVVSGHMAEFDRVLGASISALILRQSPVHFDIQGQQQSQGINGANVVQN